jgi:hypothetical protein
MIKEKIHTLHTNPVTCLIGKLTTQNKLLKIVAFALCAMFVSTQLKAQDRIELGLFAGTSYYVGDLNPGTPFKNPHLAIGGIARYIATDRWAFKGAYTTGVLSGSYPQKNLVYVTAPNEQYAFNRRIHDVALMAEFNFLSYDHQFLSNTTFTPYITTGIATSIYSRFNFDTPSSDGATVFILSLPFGLGVKYKLTNWIRIGAEWTMRKTFTDDLDYKGGVTTLNPTDPYGLNQPANMHNNDWYSFAGITVTFNMLKRKTSCNSGF